MDLVSPLCCSADPPTIKKTQSSETPVGRMGMLQCDATAVPTPEFEWYRDEKRWVWGTFITSHAQTKTCVTLHTSNILAVESAECQVEMKSLCKPLRETNVTKAAELANILA